jgi:hypothetical protein
VTSNTEAVYDYLLNAGRRYGGGRLLENPKSSHDERKLALVPYNAECDLAASEE